MQTAGLIKIGEHRLRNIRVSKMRLTRFGVDTV